MNIYIKVFYISLFIIYSSDYYSQSITNPSMEDKPADATMPSGWFSMSRGTTPDILPGYWGVYTEAEDGDTYVGLITRSDGSQESIGQRLESELEKGSCYNMELYLAHSDNYSGYNAPIQLRIWIGSKKGKKEQLIFTSPIMRSEDWTRFAIDFYPEKSMHYLILEAYNPGKKNVQGNILIDNILGPKNCNRV